MSGGGKPRSGGMSSKLVEEFSDSQIQQAEDELRKSKEDKQHVIGELNQLNSLYSEINHRRMGKQREMEKANIEARTYEDFLRDAERKAEKLQHEHDQFQGQVD